MQEDLFLALVTYETFLTILHSGKVQGDFEHLANFRTSSNIQRTNIPLAKYESRIDTDRHRHLDEKKFLSRGPRERVNDTANTSPMYITSMIYTSTHDRH